MSNLATIEKTPAEVDRPLTQTFNLSGSVADLPDLYEATEIPIDLMSDYWTPETTGEAKFVFFDKIGFAKVIDQQSGDIIDLECAFFVEQKENKELRSIRNGSKRLVGACVALNLENGTALKITYKGKKKNRTGPNSSDNWSIKPLLIKIG